MEQCINCGALKGPPKEQKMKKDTAYMSLKEGHELKELITYINHLGMVVAGASFLAPTLEDLNERIKNFPDQHGNYRIVKVTVELIDG